MRRKIIWIGLIAGVVVIALVVGGFWYLSMQPLYRPGMVREAQNLGAPLAPPQQSGEAWLVEQGIELSHFSEGSGRNVLVIHGGPGQPFTQPMSGLQPLTAAYRFHYYAQRGCGASSRPIERFESRNMYQNMQALDRALGLGAQLADIERIRRILGEEKLILIGHSWGGFLASLYAAEFPEHVEALILISPANTLVMPQPKADSAPSVDSDLFASVRARLPAGQQAEFDAFMQEYMDFNALFEKTEDDLVALNVKFGEYFGAAMQLEGEASAGETLSLANEEQARPGGWMVWAQYVSMGQRHDYRQALAGVAAPVLVIHGADDFQSEAASRMYAEAFPNARFAVIEGATHFAYDEQPEEFAQMVQDFLESLK